MDLAFAYRGVDMWQDLHFTENFYWKTGESWCIIAAFCKRGETMLFRKKNQRCCGLCLYATPQDEDSILCSKKGQRDYEDKCFSFTYDPCKRVPSKAKALDTSKFEEYDYSL